MIARRPADAVEQYRSVVQRILACVTEQVLTIRAPGGGNPYGPSKFPRAMMLADGRNVSLRSPDHIQLRVLMRFELVDGKATGTGWTARTSEYAYTLLSRTESDVSELISYHWQPDVRPGVRIPHLHIGPAIAGSSMQIGTRTVNRIHFPTGIMSMASVVRLAIEELSVEPLRSDWQSVLADNQVQ